MMSLTERQQQILDQMQPGRWYNCRELGTSRTALSVLYRRRLVEKDRDPEHDGYLSMDIGMRFRRVGDATKGD